MSAIVAWLASHKTAIVTGWKVYRSIRSSRLRNQWKGESLAQYYRRIALKAARGLADAK